LIIERFKTEFAKNIFRSKYSQGPNDSWDALADRLIDDVCGTRGGTLPPLMSAESCAELAEHIKTMRFLPGGRYLYYSGRPHKAYNNCYLLRAEEDTREEWANVTWRAMSCLMTGGGIGIDYSRLRPSGRVLKRTGGTASGPLPLMFGINELGRQIMQGGSRRSAIYASLNWQHEDISQFLTVKNWNALTREQKALDFNYAAPLDMTNISVNYDDASLKGGLENNPVFMQNVRQAMETGEPGFSFNFGDKQNETLRNACTEVTSEDDSDVCNLGWEISRVWNSSKTLWHLPHNSLSVELYALTYPMPKCTKLERRIDGLDWALWEFTNGSLREDRNMR
jgi:ribonucleoside-diphosphate reductase alpha chain